MWTKFCHLKFINIRKKCDKMALFHTVPFMITHVDCRCCSVIFMYVLTVLRQSLKNDSNRGGASA